MLKNWFDKRPVSIENFDKRVGREFDVKHISGSRRVGRAMCSRKDCGVKEYNHLRFC